MFYLYNGEWEDEDYEDYDDAWEEDEYEDELDDEWDDEDYEDYEDYEDEWNDGDDADGDLEEEWIESASFVCEDCNYRWIEKDDEADVIVCPMCGSDNITQIE